jgi:hypothetical protein
MTSKLKVNLINDGGDNNIITSNGSGVITSSKFKIGQLSQIVKSDTFNMNSSTYADVTGMSASITPSSTSSKVLVLIDTQVSSSVTYNVHLRLLRDSTEIHTKVQRIAQDGQGQYREYPLTYIFLDSPSTTSSTTFKLQMKVNGQPAYMNRPADTGGYNPSGVESNSTLTLMEVLP